MHGGLVERRGDDRIDLPCHGQIACAEDVIDGGRTGGGALLADRDAVGRRVFQVDQRHVPGLIGADLGVRDDVELRKLSKPPRGPLQDAPIPDHKRPAVLEDIDMSERLQHDLRTNSGRIAHGNGQEWFSRPRHLVSKTTVNLPVCAKRSVMLSGLPSRSERGGRVGLIQAVGVAAASSTGKTVSCNWLSISSTFSGVTRIVGTDVSFSTSSPRRCFSPTSIEMRPISTGCCIEAAASLSCLINSTLSGLPSKEAKATSSARPDSSSAAYAPSAASSCCVKKPQAWGFALSMSEAWVCASARVWSSL